MLMSYHHSTLAHFLHSVDHPHGVACPERSPSPLPSYSNRDWSIDGRWLKSAGFSRPTSPDRVCRQHLPHDASNQTMHLRRRPSTIRSSRADMTESPLVATLACVLDCHLDSFLQLSPFINFRTFWPTGEENRVGTC